MTITPLTGLKDYVAEIKGVSVERITEEQFNQIHQALLKYKVVVVRDQGDLSIEGQRNFTKRFGRLHIHLESSSHLPGYQDVNVVSNMKVNGSHIGLFGKHVENFHADLSWHSLPAKITVLKSVIRPDQCGDTEFTNTIAAYDHLPSYLKKALTGKTANYCYLKLREIDANGQVENLNADELEGANRCAVHPIFTTHPITGQRNIFANPSDTSQINNMTFSESEQLLQQLFQHTADQRFIYRHQYQDNDFVLWDNRAVHHRATGCPEQYPRKLIRITVSDDDQPQENIHVQHPYDLSKDRIFADQMNPVYTIFPQAAISLTV